MEKDFKLKEAIKAHIKKALAKLPKNLRQEVIVRETIKCALFNLIIQNGFTPIPSYKPPRRPEEPIALIGLNKENEIVCAIAIAPVITLSGVKTLKVIDAGEKYFVTFSPFKKKVEESAFFLEPGVVHIHVHETQ